ncbi:MAG TPA: hypothetical protein VF831_06050 [Anaerolineales bacterium]
MSITFTKLLSDCMVSAGDSDAETWPRPTVAMGWAKEAISQFPILRPQLDDHTNGGSVVYSYSMPAGFREIISVEYPISQQPPEYLVRKNHLDPDFYDQAGFYDIDYDFSTGSGYLCYVSGGSAASAHIKVQYLAMHETDLDDNSADLITVPDQFENILIAYFIMRAWRERLGFVMRDPTTHSNIVYQLTDMVRKAELNYKELVDAAQRFISESKTSSGNKVDKFDRVY